MFNRSGTDDFSFSRTISIDSDRSTSSAPKGSTQSRVYMTSLKSIAASSPSKTSWSRNNDSNSPDSAPSPVRRALRRLVQWPKIQTAPDLPACDSDDPIISDSISDSKRLQKCIIGLPLEDVETAKHVVVEKEVRCCKKEEADQVIYALQKRAQKQINEGRLDSALQNLNNSLSLQQKLYGKTHPKVAGTLNIMGTVLSNMGEDYRYMAMSALEESLAIWQETEPGSERTADTLKNLWLLLHESNVAISSVGKDAEEEITFHDFDNSTQVVY